MQFQLPGAPISAARKHWRAFLSVTKSQLVTRRLNGSEIKFSRLNPVALGTETSTVRRMGQEIAVNFQQNCRRSLHVPATQDEKALARSSLFSAPIASVASWLQPSNENRSKPVRRFDLGAPAGRLRRRQQ